MDGAQILFLNWRDCRNPEAGGSEIYVETIARALAAGGNRVTIHAASFPGCRKVEWVDGVRIIRSGTKLSVYAHALRALRSGDLGTPDVIVDVQNGIPFASPLAARAPTVVLVHHVHREQWPVVYGPVRSRIGWFIESHLAPRVYRKSRYVAVSRATRDELVGLGVGGERIDIVHNGVQPRATAARGRSSHPRILVLGRMVPHKRVEHVLLAASRLQDEVRGLSVSVVGDGWWRAQIEELARGLGVSHLVEFHGFVDESTKQSELEKAWVLALPSLKEGWGLVVTEAAAHGVPSVAYRSAGGVTESIIEGESGLLIDGGQEEFTAGLRRVLADEELRAALSRGAAQRANDLSWQGTANSFGSVLAEVTGRAITVGIVDAEPTLSGSLTRERSDGAP